MEPNPTSGRKDIDILQKLILVAKWHTVFGIGINLMKIKSLLVIAAIAISMLSVAGQAQAEDNKFKAGAKKVGNAIMWAPRKIGHGISAGWKKMTGK